MEQLEREFVRLSREHDRVGLDAWLAAAAASPLGSFARGIRKDYDAVRAAVVESWSNGPVARQINRLKMLRRQMYGRAGFELLRARVLAAA